MSIPPRFLDELRDRLTLSEVIGRRLKVTRAGREFKACCPFHHEKSPSFYVNDDKQFYHCFGCGAHGDVIGFLMQNDGLSFIEAVEALAAEAGMQVPAQSPQAIEQAKKEKSLHDLLNDTALFFESSLQEARHRDALSYLYDRGVPEISIASFRLGFAPVDGRALFRHLKDKGYETSQMVEAGVVRRSEKGGDPYSFFRERVMFPVTDRRGRVVAFGGRVLPEHLRPQAYVNGKPPKYINSSDSPLFHKGTILYSEARARQAAQDNQSVIVVEGYLDVMACFGAGFAGAVAPLGTALTEDQILSLWKMMPGEEKTPILCFDGDDAGRRAAVRASARLLPLLKPYHSARFAFLPQGQDPDSLIRALGRKAFEAVVEAAIPLADVLWMHHTEGRRFVTPEARAGLAAALEEDTLKIPDRAVQQYYRQMFRDRLYKAFAPQRKEWKGKNAAIAASVEQEKLVRRPSHALETLSPLILLAMALNHPHIIDSIEEFFATLAFPDPRIDRLKQEVAALIGADHALDGVTLQTHLKERGFAGELDQILSPLIYNHAGFARSGATPDKVLAGLQEIMRRMGDEAWKKEYERYCKIYREDPSELNELRISEFRNLGSSEQ